MAEPVSLVSPALEELQQVLWQRGKHGRRRQRPSRGRECWYYVPERGEDVIERLVGDAGSLVLRNPLRHELLDPYFEGRDRDA